MIDYLYTVYFNNRKIGVFGGSTKSFLKILGSINLKLNNISHFYVFYDFFKIMREIKFVDQFLSESALVENILIKILKNKKGETKYLEFFLHY